MSKIEWKKISPETSWADLSSLNVAPRLKPHLKTSSSAPASANAGRRNNRLRASLRVTSDNGAEDGPVNIVRRDCIAWQTMSQHLTLQLEQRRRSELAARRIRPTVSTEEHKDHVTVLIDKTDNLKMPSTTVEVKPSYFRSDTADDASEFNENTIEDTKLLKMDVHVISLEKLTERFNTDLTKGLTDDTVTQHRSTFGQNKLTPAHEPSLLWMFIKELVIGFNGILWIATLFAFLSYVSFLHFISSMDKEIVFYLETIW